MTGRVGIPTDHQAQGSMRKPAVERAYMGDVDEDSSIGASAVLVAPVTLGRDVTVAAAHHHRPHPVG